MKALALPRGDWPAVLTAAECRVQTSGEGCLAPRFSLHTSSLSVGEAGLAGWGERGSTASALLSIHHMVDTVPVRSTNSSDESRSTPYMLLYATI